MNQKPNLFKRWWLDFNLSRTTSDLQAYCRELDALRHQIRAKLDHIKAVQKQMKAATPDQYSSLTYELVRTQDDLAFMRLEESAQQDAIDLLICRHSRLADRKAGRAAA